jgi:hypothetical protein
MLHLYSEANPRRPVNWRYERARSIIEGGPPLSRKYDDAWVARAVKFRQEYNYCEGEMDHALLAMKYPDVYWAHDIWYNTINPDGANPFKSEMEARILSADTYGNVATRLATTMDVVTAYEKLFFNIEERRHNRGYIAHQVMGPAIYLGIQETDFDILWKLLGYMGGPVVLDMMIDGFVGAGRPTTTAELAAFLSDATQNAIRRKALLAATTIRLNNYNAVEMIGGFIKLLEIERALGRGASTEALLGNVDMMLKALPIRVGEGVVTDVPALDRYDSGRVELRYEEVVAVGLGRDIPADAVLERYAFPPPPERPAGTFQLTEGH